MMQAFHIHYRNTQGTLMRILNAASRRGIDMSYVQATPNEHAHVATLLLDVNPRQTGQLCRDWHAIVDVVKVRASAIAADMAKPGEWSTPHPPATVSASGSAARSAMA